MKLEANKGLIYTLLNEPLTFLGGLLFFLMIYSPEYNLIIKMLLIAVLLIATISSRIIFEKINLTKAVLLWYVIFISHGIFFTVLGFINHNNTYYVLRTTTYNILWPVLYLVFTIGLYKK